MMRKNKEKAQIPTAVFLGVCTVVLLIAAKSYRESMMVVPTVLSSTSESYAVFDAEDLTTGERRHSVLRNKQPMMGEGYQLELTESDFLTYAMVSYTELGKEPENSRVLVGKPQLFGSLKFTITGFTSAGR